MTSGVALAPEQHAARQLAIAAGSAGLQYASGVGGSVQWTMSRIWALSMPKPRG